MTATATLAQATGGLAGTIYFDSTDSGTYNASDLGLPNATVQLFIEGSSGSWTEVTVAQTDSSGDYSFTNLAVGTYQIRETTPAYFLDGNDSGITGESPAGTMTQGRRAGGSVASSTWIGRGRHGVRFARTLWVSAGHDLRPRLLLTSALRPGTQLLEELQHHAHHDDGDCLAKHRGFRPIGGLYRHGHYDRVGYAKRDRDL